jgi:hypothetical protein
VPNSTEKLMTEKMDRRVARHLEYLGYDVAHQSDGWHYAVHPVRHNVHFRSLELGVLVHTLIWIGNHAADEGAWLEFVNRANESCLLARYMFGRDGEGTYFVRVRALLPGTYERRLFGLLMDAWHQDLAQLRSAPIEESADESDQEDKEKPATVVN